MLIVYFIVIVLIFFLVFTVYYFANEGTFSGEIKDKNFKNPEENKLNFLWSKGLWEKDEYVLKGTENTSLELINKQFFKDIIWIRTTSKPKQDTCDLDIFSNNLDKLEKPVILVSSDGDKSIPSDLKENTYQKIINCDKIKKWYTQNYDGTSDNLKLKPYPIGLDFHTERTLFGIPVKFLPSKPASEKINYLLSIRKIFSKKISKIFCDVHLNPTSKFNNERSRLKEILNNSNNLNFLKFKTDQKNIWNKYASHKFVISAFGNGLDCHRTWECLFLGAIVIVKKSSLDPLYKDLPVVILDDWDECLDSKNLVKWEKEYSHLTNYEHLNKFFTYDHWIN